MRIFSKKKKAPARKKNNKLIRAIIPYIIKALPALIILGIFVFAAMLLAEFVQGSNYFVTEEVLLYIDGKKADPEIRSLYNINIKENIFSADLESLQARLSKQHPEALKIWTWRLLPNRIVVEVVQRTPVAQVFHGGRYYPIDKEAVILTRNSGARKEGLCVLSGIEGKTGKIATGTRCLTKNFKKAIELLEEVEVSNASRYLGEFTIDCTDPENLLIITQRELEVRMGAEDYKKRVAYLKDVMDRLKNEAATIRYIDLRFDDVVIGPKLSR